MIFFCPQPIIRSRNPLLEEDVAPTGVVGVTAVVTTAVAAVVAIDVVDTLAGVLQNLHLNKKCFIS